MIETDAQTQTQKIIPYLVKSQAQKPVIETPFEIQFFEFIKWVWAEL